MLGLSPGIKIPYSSISGHSTFVLSTIDIDIEKNTSEQQIINRIKSIESETVGNGQNSS